MTAMTHPNANLSSQSLLFRFCEEGTAVSATVGYCFAAMKEQRYEVFFPQERSVFTMPSPGGYLISLSEATVPFGFHSTGLYRVPNVRGTVFPLGFSGTMKLRFAHIAGLSQLLDGKMQLSFAQLLPLLSSQLKPLAAEAVESLGLNGNMYFDILRQKRSLCEELEKRIFPVLFRYGLALVPDSIQIERFSRPTISFSQGE
jgi:hypothetical protein